MDWKKGVVGVGEMETEGRLIGGGRWEDEEALYEKGVGVRGGKRKCRGGMIGGREGDRGRKAGIQ